MADARILVVVKEADARGAYEEILQRVGVSYDIAETFTDLQRMSSAVPYSGLLVDILTLIRCSKEEKAIAYDCLNYYPSLRLKWDGRDRSINLSPLEQSDTVDVGASLSFFVETRCKAFTARTLRRFDRKESYLNLLLSPRPECGEGECLKTFTLNISRGGAFVHTTDPLQKGEPVWLRFLELPANEPLKAVVCWCIEWGTCRGIPGIGVQFEGLTDQQLDRIRKMANL
ncbi:PilZ domain-containing protein [Geomonas sp.]|uniref:PilZ domain-containing protein n=1 Tax=Geomonas sp. TaxID=2651584 RepID=UPI002B45B4E2|nr:PilZ domain-containing protein [Geomonas sp.]HJV36997.1 PilZ domain-containing protein [Geomonas sp.]